MNPTTYAPVAFFVYNRFDHTRQTLEALAKNTEASHTRLIVFSDGPKTPEDESKVTAVRNLIRAAQGFASVELVEKPQNVGLAESIIQGVGKVLETSETVIVLEDDLVSSPYFLKFMNDSLRKYADVPQVASVLGYSFPTGEVLPETYFLRGADCWGWATWRRAWKFFERDGTKLLAEIQARKLENEFDLEGSIDYVKMLEDQIAKRNHSWAIRWRASVFLQGAFALYPGRSLIQNIGMDGTGTHCTETDMYTTLLAQEPVSLSDIEIKANRAALDGIIRYYRRNKPTFPQRVRSFLKRKIRRVLGLKKI